MHCEPPPITFIPYEEHFRPVLPTIEGNVDYLALRGQLTTMDELLRTSGVENEFVRRSLEHWIKTLSESKMEQIELSGEGQSGVIGLEDLVSGKQQVRFQEHSVRALRCSRIRRALRTRIPRRSVEVRENPNWTILGVERKFAPIERLKDTAEGIWSSFQGEKRLDCLISV